ncbi:hypothetical protein Kpol_1063p7 [Vanderwaltozyma polyspora DSM 70294]|uniref:Uncharacterized protein n=1 Tax=Vanderwaltozyma polyspora (strain ATCC 22028 / DSM 70294 / BCRC 21397 / CBS 2163 / NBRC 10782 / NRRL Y-8283 / UCD 57-17) TaxID=436907 RepID=A7TQQ2_VANPO|nr:uncharacterized protein Kpol_1063p7 [Vanderwaltozyma polyspora DSM 70294]EDO15397.1 hypothetical protein Kpol_1063p7 [Vanderwaltozyma polyspora DSM 70294]
MSEPIQEKVESVEPQIVLDNVGGTEATSAENSPNDNEAEKENKIDYDDEAQKLQEKAYRFMAKQTHAVIIPSYSSWFDFSDIHEIEKKAFPDFFDNSLSYKTLEVYKDARDFMINSYRLTPYEYLTMTAVRKNLALDVASIMRIHAFLEKWGLINYQLDPRSKSSLNGANYSGHFDVVLDAPEGLKPFLPSKLIKNEELKKEDNGLNESQHAEEGQTGATATDGDISMETTQTEENSQSAQNQQASQSINVPEHQFTHPDKFPVNLSLKKTAYDSVIEFNNLQSNDKPSRVPQRTYVCFTCGNDTVYVRYHNLRARDVNLCSRCFQEGHFGASFQASDFIKLTNNSNTSSKVFWSDQEILLLLEGIEIYEDQWEKIAEHIGTNKTVLDCVEKFLKLPIEDQYIDDIIGKSKGSEEIEKLNQTIGGDISIVEAVDKTIISLLQGDNKDILEKNIPMSADVISKKYLKEAEVVTQELVDITLKRLHLKFKELDRLEDTLEKERIKFEEQTKQLADNRSDLSKQITDLNSHLEKLSVSKKLVLISEQVDSTIKVVEKEEQTAAEEADNKELQKKKNLELEALTNAAPAKFKPWSF